MKTLKLTAIALLALALVLVLFTAGCTQSAGTSGSTASPASGSSGTSANGSVGILETAGVGPMPSLLATGQVDGYLAWQPVVEAGVESNIGHVAVYSKDLPPAGEWSHHPQNVFVVRKDFYAQNPDFVNDFAALNLAATQYINNHPQETATIDANWLAGGQNFTYGNVSVSSVTVVDNAIPTIEFSNDPSDSWKASTSNFVQSLITLGTVKGFVANSTDQDAVLYNFQPYTSAEAILAAKNVTTPAPVQNTVGVGYLLALDHSALFVAVKDWQYFNDTYGIALKPEDLTAAKPSVADFMVNGQKVATVNLVPANAGPNLMQLAATNSIQMSYVGVPPAINAIDQGTPITIAYPIDNLGSGLVVANGAPAQDWQSFAAWAKERSDAGKPLVIAAPGKGSIQDVMIRAALQNSGITVTEVKV